MKRKFNLCLMHIVFGILFFVVADSKIGFAAAAWQEEWERVLERTSKLALPESMESPIPMESSYIFQNSANDNF